jgi:nitrate reductase (NAD(P)H)
MSRYNELLIAYRMNNDIIPPDHGFPLRAIVPGWVGGRQVKWLQRISLSNLPSNNWYHLHDNRVFPPSTLDKSDAERLHGSTDPDTELQELNVNSAIVFPRHNDEIASSSWSSTLSETIMFRGYAYSNGHRIRRVDLTLDDGKNWLTCQRQTLPEDDRFVWCIWSCYIPVYQLIRTKRVRVRAFDSAFNTQPESWTWNLMGMMNNSQYEVRVELISKGNEISLRFLHPVLPGSTRGGFLDDESGIPPQHTSAQLSETVDYATAGKHQTNSDCWIIIDNVVYDVTPFLKDHPGGSAPILALAGRDASAEFHAIHTKDAYILKEKFAIAKIKPGE